tara:strand:- start:812 stop:1057 length:246 start_codon:yes stop_codon:yes gene_type:complete
MALSRGIIMALNLIKSRGVNKGMSAARRANVPSADISEARKLAFANPKKYLPKWHVANKSAVQKKIDARRRAEELARKGKK